MLPSLLTTFTGYGSYHANTVYNVFIRNKLIHIVGVPLIVFSLFGIFQHFSFRYPIK